MLQAAVAAQKGGQRIAIVAHARNFSWYMRDIFESLGGDWRAVKLLVESSWNDYQENQQRLRGGTYSVFTDHAVRHHTPTLRGIAEREHEKLLDERAEGRK